MDKQVVLFILKRLSGSIGIVLCLTLITFILIFALPSDPARAILGAKADQVTIENLRKELGLDKPIYNQYMLFLGRLSRGDLGKSYATGEKVISAIWERAKSSSKLIIFSLIFSTFIGILFGIALTYLDDSKWLTLLDLVSLGGSSLPVFLISIIFSYFLGYVMGILPIAGYESGIKGLKYLVLPVLSLSVVPLCMIARVVYAKLKDILVEPFIITHRAYGFSESKILFKYGLKNALISVISILTNIIALVMGSAIFVEYIFSLPGVFSYAAEAILRYDTPIIQGTVLMVAIVFVVVTAIIDIFYAILDPRVSIG